VRPADSTPEVGTPVQKRGSESVQSVSRACALLRCFVASPLSSYSLTDLAQQTGMNVSTAFRLAKTLCAESLLSYDQRTERYQIGPVLVALGTEAMRSAGLSAALPVIQELANATGATAALSIREGRMSVSVLSASSLHGLRVVETTGSRIPLHLTAAGKALLAFGAEPVLAAVKNMGRLEKPTKKTLSSSAALKRDLDQAKIRGYTVCDEERDEGVRAVGAPVLDERFVARAAVGIQGPVVRIPTAQVPELGSLLQAAAKECSSLLDLQRLP
jgi:IclR family transcriptional regulator, acetate operon repressor